jgi:hypothetical protein
MLTSLVDGGRTGAGILAQCKKDPHPVPVADGFLKAIADLGENGIAFYFAYGGFSGSVPATVNVIGPARRSGLVHN